MPNAVPPNLPGKIYLITRSDGERLPLYGEPLEGPQTWAKGLNITVAEYDFKEVVYRPPPPKPKTRQSTK